MLIRVKKAAKVEPEKGYMSSDYYIIEDSEIGEFTIKVPMFHTFHEVFISAHREKNLNVAKNCALYILHMAKKMSYMLKDFDDVIDDVNKFIDNEKKSQDEYLSNDEILERNKWFDKLSLLE